MSKAGAPRPDPTVIGEVAAPSFVRLPQPLAVFASRAERFRALADGGHDLGPYLRFLGALSESQHRVQADLPKPDTPAHADRLRAREHGMPVLDRSRFTADATLDTTLDSLFALARDIDMPGNARAALERASGAGVAMRNEMVQSVLADAMPAETLADHIFVTAALQVHFARMAACLESEEVRPVSDSVCPVCGGAPAVSMIVGWSGAHGVRYCVCSLCTTLWHVVRVKCVVCGSTKGIGYQEVDGSPGTIKGETCDNCHSYVKILHQHKNRAFDPIADDVASLGLDLLLRESGYRRGGFNPFLLGY